MDETEECIWAFGTSIHPLVHIHHRYLQLYQTVEARYVSHSRLKWLWLHHSVIQGATPRAAFAIDTLGMVCPHTILCDSLPGYFLIMGSHLHVQPRHTATACRGASLMRKPSGLLAPFLRVFLFFVHRQSDASGATTP